MFDIVWLYAGMFDKKSSQLNLNREHFCQFSVNFCQFHEEMVRSDVMHMPSGPPCSLSQKMLEFAATATRITRITRTEAQCFSISTLNKMVLNYLNGLKLWWRYTRHSKTKLISLRIWETCDILGRLITLAHTQSCPMLWIVSFEVMPLHLCRSGA